MISNGLKVDTNIVKKCIDNLQVLSGQKIDISYINTYQYNNTHSNHHQATKIQNIVITALEMSNSSNAASKVYLFDDAEIIIEVTLYDSVLLTPIAVIYTECSKMFLMNRSIVSKPIFLCENQDTILHEILSNQEFNALSEMILTIAEFLITKGFIAKRTDITGKIADYINTHFAEDLSADVLCKELLISKNNIYSAIKEEFNMTLGQYIQAVRLDKASCLLKETNKSIMEISEECGIGDFNYFSRIFRKYFNLPPTTYRKNFA